MSSFLTRLALDYRWPVLIVLLLVTLDAARRIPTLRIDPDYAAFLPEDAPEFAALRAAQEGESRRMLFLLLDDPDRVEQLGAQLRSADCFERVDLAREAVLGGNGEFTLHDLDEPALRSIEQRFVRGRADALHEMRDRLATDAFAGREIALRDPLGIGWILRDAVARRLPKGLDPESPWLVAREFALIRVIGRVEPSNLAYSRRVVATVLEAEAALGLEIQMVGGYHEAVHESTRMRRDLIRATWASVLLVAVYLMASFRSWRAPLMLLTPTILATVWMLGFGSALLGPLNPLAIAAAALLAGLGVDFAIHFSARLREELTHKNERAALAATYSHTGRLSVLALLTTLVAFAPFATGAIPALRQFAWLLAIGLSAALIVTLLLLPNFRRVLPRADRPGPFIRFCMRLRQRRKAAFLLGAAGMAGAAAIPFVTITTDSERFRGKDNPVAQAEVKLGEILGFSPRPVTALHTNPDSMREAIAELEQRGIVLYSRGPHRAVPQIRIDALRTAVRGWRTAAEKDLEALDLNPEPFTPALERYEQLLRRNRPEEEGRYRLFLPSGYENDAELMSEVRHTLGRDATLFDLEALRTRIVPLLQDELRRAFLIAVPAIILIVVVALRRFALVSLIPIGVGLGITTGTLVLFDIPLHPGNLVALPFLLGLGIDDGVHMAGRIAEDNRDPLPTTGQAVFRTSATSLLAFGSLMLATTPALRSLGTVLSIGIFACLLAAVVILPSWARR